MGRGNTGRAFVLLVTLTSLLLAVKPAIADTSTPVPSPVATAAPVTTVTPISPLPTVVPEVTGLATVTREGASPVSTFTAATPSPALAPSPTALPEFVTPTPVPLAPGPTAVNTPIMGTGAGPGVSGPTPAQLEQSARLRWGNGIPASVRRWAFLIVPAAHRFHLDPNLIAAVMTMESNGDPLAESPADARGLMQILHGPWDPRTNVFQGASMLATLYSQFGDWTLVLAAYNAGPGAVESYGGVPPFRETQDYVVIVRYLWDLFGHHHLTTRRRTQYRATLKDLTHFADQRRKVSKLARIAHVAPITAGETCATNACVQLQAEPAPMQGDPFWPVGGLPDPLQRVAPPGQH